MRGGWASAPTRPCGPLCRRGRRRSLAAALSLRLGSGPRRESSRRLASAPTRPYGPLCRAPPGELPRGRRSLAYRPTAISPSGVRAQRSGAIPTVGFCTDAALRAAGAGPHRENCPHDRALLHTLAGHEKDPALTLTWHSVTSAGFALPRDAGRRPPPGELAGAPRPPPGELPRGRRSLACGP